MADVVRWDPFSDMMSLRQAMDRLFQDAWVRPWTTVRDGVGLGTLPVDLSETGDELVLTATVPGVKPEDIEITVQGDLLTIRGETTTDAEVKDQTFHRRERQFGRFSRQVVLPVPVKSDNAEAHFENGVLRLRLPKAEEAKERKIPIQGATGGTRQIHAA